MPMLAFRGPKGQFKIINNTYLGRLELDNSSRIILRNVTLKDTGLYICRIEYSSESYERKVHLKVGG